MGAKAQLEAAEKARKDAEKAKKEAEDEKKKLEDSKPTWYGDAGAIAGGGIVSGLFAGGCALAAAPVCGVAMVGAGATWGVKKAWWGRREISILECIGDGCATVN